MIEPGAPAPDFTLADADGRDVSLSDLVGQPVVVYFYPRDDTPGCTAQACGIRDRWSELRAAGAAVVGISPDDVASHARFRAKHDLPHILLADPDREVIGAYGAWGTKTRSGQTYEGVLRTTVLVASDGTVARVWPQVDATAHADQVLAALGDLEA